MPPCLPAHIVCGTGSVPTVNEIVHVFDKPKPLASVTLTIMLYAFSLTKVPEFAVKTPEELILNPFNIA